MKKYASYITLLVLAGILGISCEKEDLVSTDKFESLLRLPGTDERRVAFNELSSDEKAGFWKYSLRKSMTGMPGQQRQFLKEVHDKLSPAAYIKNSRENMIITTLLVPGWVKKAETLFAKDRIHDLFYFLEGERVVKSANHIYQTDQQVREPQDYYSESAPNCLCNIGSGYTCRKKSITVGTNGASSTVTYGSCSYSPTSYVCDRDDYGCGYGGFWACNGNSCTY